MSLGSGPGFDTGLWDMFGFDVQSSTPELAKAVTLLVLLMRRDKVLDIQKGAYYATVQQAVQFPNVVILFDEVPTVKRGPGWRMERPRLHVLFRLRSAKRVPLGRLAWYAERLTAILEENPRLGDTKGETGVNRARVASWKPLYASGQDWVEDVADVTVEITIIRKVR